MKVRDLPVRLRALQLLLKPGDLLGLQIRAFKREKSYTLLPRWLERVVLLAVHVEQLVVALFLRVVMVAKRGIELHAGIEQRLVRILELLLEILRPLRSVEIVADEGHQVEGKLIVGAFHLGSQLVPLLAAGAEVTQDRELQRVILVRHRQRKRSARLRRLRLWRRLRRHRGAAADE